ncbi:MAG TPA: ABC transporter ATP-binding protein [Sphingobacteriaceae bacterium]|nr:ABC transporter ATP-binding protein [Sphingobacteriaceae bacterium]
MIEISNLEKLFNRGQANEVYALKNINLSVGAKEFVVIVGANGSGKTSLLNCISGSILPSSGDIKISGNPVTHLPDYKRSKWIARVFQNPLCGTAPDLSILNNFRLASLRTSSYGLRIGINEAFRAKVKEKIASLKMGLENKIDQPMGTLSGGQRQALTLLMSVMDEAHILLLDEPTAALDPRSAETVMKTADQLIKEYGLTAILITHNLKEAFQYGSRIIQMAEGKIIKDVNSERKSAIQQTEIYEWFA